MRPSKEMLQGLTTNSLEMIIADSERRIGTNPSHIHYVKEQQELIRDCQELIEEKQ